jgi:hypothetical protein
MYNLWYQKDDILINLNGVETITKKLHNQIVFYFSNDSGTTVYFSTEELRDADFERLNFSLVASQWRL